MLAVRRTGIPTFFEDFDRLNHLFDANAWSAGDLRPAVDVYDDADNYVVTAELPGIDKDKLDLEIEDNVLTITAERGKTDGERNYHRKEISRGTYTRSMKFSTPVDATKVKASYKDGLLEITLPKEEKVKPKKIKIASA